MLEGWKKNQNLYQSVIIFLVMLLFAFLFLVRSPLHIWRHGESGIDSSVYKTVAYMMSKGALPYRDTFDHKGPLLYFLNYIGMNLAFYRGIWFVEFCFMMVSIVGMYRIARLMCGKALSCFVVLTAFSPFFSFFDGGNLVEEYAIPFITMALSVFLRYFTKKTIDRKQLFLCGFCFGAVCLLRPNMVAVWIVFCVAVLIECLWEKKTKRLPGFILWFCMGMSSIVLPFVVWMAYKGCLADCMECYIHFNALYTEKLSLFHRMDAFFYFLNQDIVIISFIVCICFAIGRKSFLYYSYIVCLLLTLCFVAMSGYKYAHYGMVLIPLVVFPLASLMAECEKQKMQSINLAAMVTALWLLVSIIAPLWLPHLETVVKIYEERNSSGYSQSVQDICKIIMEKTSEDDAISVYGNMDIIYILSHREHATKYSYQYPLCGIKPEILQDYIRQLQEELPKIIVTGRQECDNEMIAFLEENQYICIWIEDGEDWPVKIYEHIVR